MVAVGNKSLKAFQAVAGIFGDEDICKSSRVTGVRRVACVCCVVVPPVISRPPLSTRVTEGDTARFDCRYTGTPFPHTRIGWRSEQRPISVSIALHQ